MTTGASGGPRRDTSAKRRSIIAAAIEVFSARGYEGSSMDRIAEVAGASKRTVYNHFASKEALFQGIVADFLAQRESLKPVQYDPREPLEDQLREFARAEMYLIEAPERRALSRLLTSVFLFDTAFAVRTHAQHDPNADLTAWIERAVGDRRLDVPSPPGAARLFYGMVEGCVTWPALMTDGASLATADATVDELVAAFLARHRVPGDRDAEAGGTE
jgi:TetR/AcrR family transcriptional regulator of autoinduction and epiphytic fitness